MPTAAQATAAGNLAFRDDNRALIRSFLSERSSDPLSRVDLLEVTNIASDSTGNP
jgi:hypothetical protein